MLTNFLKEDTWAKGARALDDQGNEVKWDSENAQKRDITSWIDFMYNKQEQRDVAIDKLRSVINTDPVLMGVHVDKDKFDLAQNRTVPLWCWNDTAEWRHVSRLITLVSLD